MYLVIDADPKDRNLYQLLWGWTSGRPGYRDMRKFLVEKLAPNVYLYTEDDWARRVILSASRNYGIDKVRAMTVNDAALDLRRLLTVPTPASP
jgi:hypothetical protein